MVNVWLADPALCDPALTGSITLMGKFENVIANMEKVNINECMWKAGLWVPGMFEHNTPLQRILEKLK